MLTPAAVLAECAFGTTHFRGLNAQPVVEFVDGLGRGLLIPFFDRVFVFLQKCAALLPTKKKKRSFTPPHLNYTCDSDVEQALSMISISRVSLRKNRSFIPVTDELVFAFTQSFISILENG